MSVSNILDDLPPWRDLAAPWLLATCFGLMFTGVFLGQCITYWREKEDSERWYMKALVPLLVALTLMEAGAGLSLAYKFLVLLERNSILLLFSLQDSPALLIIMLSQLLTSSLAQLFFALRALKVVKSVPQMCVMLLLGIATVGSNVATIIIPHAMTNPFELVKAQFTWLAVQRASAAALDVYISLVFILQLRKIQQPLAQGAGEALTSYLIRMSMQTASLTSAIAIASSAWIAVERQSGFWGIMLNTILIRSYPCTVLYVMNSRGAIREIVAATVERNQMSQRSRNAIYGHSSRHVRSFQPTVSSPHEEVVVTLETVTRIEKVPEDALVTSRRKKHEAPSVDLRSMGSVAEEV